MFDVYRLHRRAGPALFPDIRQTRLTRDDDVRALVQAVLFQNALGVGKRGMYYWRRRPHLELVNDHEGMVHLLELRELRLERFLW
jgi:hypothetical protein